MLTLDLMQCVVAPGHSARALVANHIVPWVLCQVMRSKGTRRGSYIYIFGTMLDIEDM